MDGYVSKPSPRKYRTDNKLWQLFYLNQRKGPLHNQHGVLEIAEGIQFDYDQYYIQCHKMLVHKNIPFVMSYCNSFLNYYVKHLHDAWLILFRMRSFVSALF